MTSKAVFLDKDGTLVEDIPYNVDPDRVRLMEGALEGLRLLQNYGYDLIVVTNQSGVARGFFDEQDVHWMMRRLSDLLASKGIFLKGYYYCPHHPEGKFSKYAVDCFCRKPQPGMLYQAALERHIRLSDSWMIGDILHDVEAGNRAGCKTILLNNDHETEWKLTTSRRPKFIVRDLAEAAQAIVSDNRVGMEGKSWQAKTPIF